MESNCGSKPDDPGSPPNMNRLYDWSPAARDWMVTKRPARCAEVVCPPGPSPRAVTSAAHCPGSDAVTGQCRHPRRFEAGPRSADDVHHQPTPGGSPPSADPFSASGRRDSVAPSSAPSLWFGSSERMARAAVL